MNIPPSPKRGSKPQVPQWKELGMEGWLQCGSCSLHMMEEDARESGCARCGQLPPPSSSNQTKQIEPEEDDVEPLALFHLFFSESMTGPDPTQITDFLFLGSMFGVKNRERLHQIQRTFREKHSLPTPTSGSNPSSKNTSISTITELPISTTSSNSQDGTNKCDNTNEEEALTSSLTKLTVDITTTSDKDPAHNGTETTTLTSFVTSECPPKLDHNDISLIEALPKNFISTRDFSVKTLSATQTRKKSNSLSFHQQKVVDHSVESQSISNKNSPAVKYSVATHNKKNIVNILNMAKEVPNKFPFEFCYKKFEFEDIEAQDILPYLDQITEWIHAAKLRKEIVVVHCAAGVSRSASVVLAYLMRYEKMTLKEAYSFVKSKRPIIYPNRGFARQLVEYEKRLFGQSTIDLSANNGSLPLF